jgi:hypothetical protein
MLLHQRTNIGEISDSLGVVLLVLPNISKKGKTDWLALDPLIYADVNWAITTATTKGLWLLEWSHFASGVGRLRSKGYIELQEESCQVEFRSCLIFSLLGWDNWMLENKLVHRKHICPATYLEKLCALCQTQTYCQTYADDILRPTSSPYVV